MRKLIEYVQQMERYARMKDASANDAEEFMHNAFGACEMCASLWPGRASEIVSKWNNELKYTFESIIQEKYN